MIESSPKPGHADDPLRAARQRRAARRDPPQDGHRLEPGMQAGRRIPHAGPAIDENKMFVIPKPLKIEELESLLMEFGLLRSRDPDSRSSAPERSGIPAQQTLSESLNHHQTTNLAPLTVTPEVLRENCSRGLPGQDPRKRGEADRRQRSRIRPPEIGANTARPRHHHPARLHLCRLPRRGHRADLRHPPHHPRPDRLRLLLLADPPQPRPSADGEPNYLQYSMSTDMQEEDIVFGGEKKLAAGDPRGLRPFKPKAIAGLFHLPGRPDRRRHPHRRRQMKEELGINVFGFSCEGYKGVSQSAGHHIANNGVFKHMVGEDDTPSKEPVQNQHPRRIQHRRRRLGNRHPAPQMRHHVSATFSGNVSYDQITKCHTGRPQRGDVPPLDQLHGRDDGDQVRHPVVQGELHRRRIHRQVAAQDRRSSSTTRN
jgi:hypothetical protein